jgi:acyl carrier protein
MERSADDLGGVEEGAFDLVIVNSVTQHFPDAGYLIRVLEGALRVLANGGRVFVGDVRSLPLLEAFHTSVQLDRADDSLPAAALRQHVRRRVLREEELVIDPALFTSLPRRLPRIGAVDVAIKRGRYWNEMVRFRYDVLIHADSDAPAPPAEWLDWLDEPLTLDDLRVRLAESVASLGIRRVPNARLQADTHAADLLSNSGGPATAGALREAARRAPPGINPEELWALGEDVGYSTSITWSAGGPAGSLDVEFRKREAPQDRMRRRRRSSEHGSELAWRSYTNDPPRAKFARILAPELRRHLAERLPDYMIPAAFVPLDALPLTLSGKIDRRALPPPEHAGDAAGADRDHIEPRTPVEARLAALWQELLGVRDIGVRENFFAIGGHSLLAVQLVSRIRDAFEVELPLRALFETPEAATVARLAEYVEALRLVASSERNHDRDDREQGEL